LTESNAKDANSKQEATAGGNALTTSGKKTISELGRLRWRERLLALSEEVHARLGFRKGLIHFFLVCTITESQETFPEFYY